jgi:hypothetical protein
MDKLIGTMLVVIMVCSVLVGINAIGAINDGRVQLVVQQIVLK